MTVNRKIADALGRAVDLKIIKNEDLITISNTIIKAFQGLRQRADYGFGRKTILTAQFKLLADLARELDLKIPDGED